MSANSFCRISLSVVLFNISNTIGLKFLYIFNKYDILPLEFVKVEGEVVKHQGKVRWYKGMTLKDAISAVGVSEEFDKQRVQIISYDENLHPHLKFVNYSKEPNFKLKPFDKITLYSYYNFNPQKPVGIFGEVNKAGIYVYTDGMTLKDLLLMGGWFNDKADRNYIELIRYNVVNNKREHLAYLMPRTI